MVDHRRDDGLGEFPEEPGDAEGDATATGEQVDELGGDRWGHDVLLHRAADTERLILEAGAPREGVSG
jgi:hypothetical protein